MTQNHSIQLDAGGQLHHLITLDALPAQTLKTLIASAGQLINPPGGMTVYEQWLHGRSVANLFFEPSTRTRCSFELAAKRLGAHFVNLDLPGSSLVKGESLADTLYTLEAMDVDLLVVRHRDAGVCATLAEASRHTAVINAGEGRSDHPTQGLLDVLTIARHKPRFEHLRVAVVGDIAHSRVARSTCAALATLGVRDLRLIAPQAWLPNDDEFISADRYTDLKQGLDGADVVMTLRIQKERMQHAELPDENSYARHYGLNENALAAAADDVIIMHPGPMNRGIEIDTAVADGPRSVIREQPRNGVAMRMAIMMHLLDNRRDTPTVTT